MARPAQPFLTARWSNLFLATYVVPDALLARRLPAGLELDRLEEGDGHRRQEAQAGRAFVSLVAFDFLDTRVLGIPWPGFRTFPEINLRFYVRRPAGLGEAQRGDEIRSDEQHSVERGVVFVREFVPSRIVAGLARALYNEPYRAVPMRSAVRETAAEIEVEHRLVVGNREHVIHARGSKPGTRPDETSVEHFFKEHRWGYGVTRRGQTARYEVAHPVWDVYAVQEYHIDLDWGAVYGPEWAFLATATAYSTILAAGSAIRVYPGLRLKST